MDIPAHDEEETDNRANRESTETQDANSVEEDKEMQVVFVSIL